MTNVCTLLKIKLAVEGCTPKGNDRPCALRVHTHLDKTTMFFLLLELDGALVRTVIRTKTGKYVQRSRRRQERVGAAGGGTGTR